MTTDTKQNPAGERVQEPAKRWFNWWFDMGENDHDQPYQCEDPWPSKEVAEQKAMEEIARDVAVFGDQVSDWLGAFPEGQRP